MPIEAKPTGRKPLRPDPVRPGETWKQYIDRVRSASAFGASQMAGIICATVLMGKAPNAPADGRMLEALSQRVAKQSSFRYVTRDPESLRLGRNGKGAELIVRMGEYKRREDEMIRRYQRDPSKTAQDAVFFKNAAKTIEDSFANHSPVQRERESSRYLEMMKRLDHARKLAEQGIPLDGKTARELAQAVQKYNDGGGKTPGGKQQAAAAKEALCVLKQIMPENEFKDYCASINRAHNAQTPAHRRYVDPASYTEELINGGARSARDLMLASQKQLTRGMTVDGCAMVTAIRKLSNGNPNAIIRREALEQEIGRLKTPGSAFLRAMSDDKSRERYAELASKGDAARLSRSILRDAKLHSARSAIWQIQQAKNSAVKEGGASPEKLAGILAARQMAATADPAQNITNGAFRAKTEEIRSSAGFAALASRYQNDRHFRDRINDGLEKGDGGKTLEQEYQRINLAPQKEKKTEIQQPVLKPEARG